MTKWSGAVGNDKVLLVRLIIWCALSAEQVLQMFVIAILVSIGLSLVLAFDDCQPVGRPCRRAAELGRDRDVTKIKPGAGVAFPI